MKSTFLVLAFLCFGLLLKAQSFKIGYTDIEYVLTQMPEYKTASTDIELFQKKLEERFRIKNDYAQSKLQEYYDMERTLTMDQKKAKEEELMKLDEELKQFEKDAQGEMQIKQDGLLAPIREKVIKAVEQVATDKGYTYILNKSGGMLNVLYGPKEDDVTELLAAKLGLTLQPRTNTTAPAPAPAPGTGNK
jgi:outer membrane protein